jgi:tetratricopeptide (TPR) repeat protein
MTSDPAASAVPTADPNEAATAGDVVSAGPTPPPRRLAVYRLGEEPKSMVARLTLKPNDDGPDHVQIESDSEEYGSKVREIIERSAGEERDQSTDPAHRAEKQLRVWRRIKDNLSAAGYGVEDISAGDYQLKFEINLQSGRHIGVQSGLHSFADSNDPLARRIAEAVADAFQRIPNDFARDINAAVATGDADAIVSAVQHGKESGAFGVRPTPALLDALGSIDVTPLSETDRRLVRECRLFTAQVLGSTNVAGIEAEALMREESDRLDDGQKAELEMTIAFAEIKKGHRETALHMWRRLLRSPAVLGAEGRGWAWRNIAITLPDDNAEKRHAAKCSADAFLESGQKDEASKSLMLLANSLLHVEPSSAISTIDEIVALIDQNSLQNRGLRAATYHARGNRLAQLGRHSEATANALKAVELWRGLIGAEESLISSLHLAAIESEVVGDTNAADAFRLEADTLTREVNAPHFTLAQRVEELAESFDQKRASDLLQDAQKLRNGEVVTAVRVIQAMQDATLSDCGRLSLLEDTLQQLDSEGAQEGTKEPARIALATFLFKLDQAERAEMWCRKILTANPISRFARDALIQSLWRREQWGDAAIFLKKQIQLMGSMPGLLYAYGRSLYEAGDFSGAVTALTQSLDASDENADVNKLARQLRENALHKGGTILAAPPERQSSAAVTREEFDAALDLFARFISGDKRMTFWTHNGKDHVWIERPEKRAQDLMHTFLKARFLERVNVFEELDTGAGRLDIFAQFLGGLTVILELKMCGFGYSSNYAASGESQLLHYMDNRGSKLGYLIAFDARLTMHGEGLLSGSSPFTVFSKFVDMRPRIAR